MRRIIVTATAVGPSPWVPIDYNNLPCSLGIGVVVTATATYTVEHTYDPLFAQPLGVITAFPNAGLTAQTTNKDGGYDRPISGVRLNVAATTGSVTMTVLQGLKG